MASGLVNFVFNLILTDKEPQIIDVVEYLSFHLILLRESHLFGGSLLLSNVVFVILLVVDNLRARSFAIKRSNLLSGGFVRGLVCVEGILRKFVRFSLTAP